LQLVVIIFVHGIHILVSSLLLLFYIYIIILTFIIIILDQPFIRDQLKLTPKEFQLLCAMSSWATIGSKDQQDEDEVIIESKEDKKKKKR